MIVDVFALIDDAPVILKRPLLPYSPSIYRIPLYADYNPQINDWPDYAWYPTENINVTALLIGGRRYPYNSSNIPPINTYTIHVQDDATFIVISFDITELWMYKRIEIIATAQSVLSMLGSYDPDGDKNIPMILSIGDIKKKADALNYARFSFESIKVDFIKDRQNIFLYGGEMILMLRYKENEHAELSEYNIGRFIMDKITYDMDKVNINGIDFRQLLNLKYPSEVFEKGTGPGQYLYIEDDNVGQVKSRCIGIGNGVPGICLNGNQIYKQLPSLEKITHFDFYFPLGWTNLYKIEVLQDESWNEIYPGLGNPFFNEQYNPNNNGQYAPILDPANGIVKIHYLQALQNGEWGNGTNQVRMYAKWPNATMKQAMTWLLSLTNDETLIENFDGEFNGLAQIGLLLDSSESVFTWFEKLQSANIIGGQLMLIDNILKFRLENPNRNKKFNIPVTDVLNHETLSIEIADEFMFSGWEIVYKKSYADDGKSSEGRNIGVNYKYPTANIYNNNDLTVWYERKSPTQQIFHTEALQQRVAIINEQIATFRHKIKKLEIPLLSKYLDLIIYDVVGYMPKALENNGQSMYDWIVYDKQISLVNEKITLTLVERIKSLNWNNGKS